MAFQVRELVIVDGPGKFDLMLALFACQKIWFTVTGEKKRKPASINLVAVGVGESNLWRIEGRLNDSEYPKFEGEYSSVTRKGKIRAVYID